MDFSGWEGNWEHLSCSELGLHIERTRNLSCFSPCYVRMFMLLGYLWCERDKNTVSWKPSISWVVLQKCLFPGLEVKTFGVICVWIWEEQYCFCLGFLPFSQSGMTCVFDHLSLARKLLLCWCLSWVIGQVYIWCADIRVILSLALISSFVPSSSPNEGYL